MKLIPLSQGLFAQVDDDDYEAAMAFKWTALKQKRTYYAYRMVKKDRKATAIYLHRFILGTPKGMVTDHRDCNGLNCQKANLRVCTGTENARNIQKIRKSTASKFKGVGVTVRTITTVRRTFSANITADGKTHYLGTFRNELDAAKAYNKAAIRLHGEFASLNPIP